MLFSAQIKLLSTLSLRLSLREAAVTSADDFIMKEMKKSLIDGRLFMKRVAYHDL